MARQSRTPTEEHIDKVIAHLRHRQPKTQAGQLERFVRLMYARASAQDLLETAVEDLYGAAAGLWRFCEIRKPGSLRLRVFAPDMENDGWTVPRTVVERTSAMISEFRATGTVDIARLALANRMVRSMLTAR